MQTTRVFSLLVAATMLMSACSTSPSMQVTQQTQPTAPSNHPTLPPSTKVTVSASTADGSHWYAFDEFDDIGGSSPYAQHQGIFREKDGVVTRYEITATIRVLKTAPDDSLYVGAGCGVLRFHAERWQTLAEPDCDHRHFSQPFTPFDIAIAANGDVWVGGVFALAHYGQATQMWTEYNVKARRLLIAPDGSVWAEGWDGIAGSDCCYSHLTGSTWVTYTHSAKLPVTGVLIQRIEALTRSGQ